MNNVINSAISQLNHKLNQFSEFRPYSMGIVASNKPMSTNEILVIPIEITPSIDGRVITEEEELVHKGVDSLGNEYQIKVKARPDIRCKWYPLGDNRVTAPDVRKGERVEIYRFGDSDEFYWVSSGLDAHLRRLETVIYRYSDIPDGKSDETPDASNCYTIEVSTHRKHVTLKTVTVNGEAAEYIIQLNTGDGAFTLTDDLGNHFQLDSVERLWEMVNGDGTYLKLDKKNIDIYAPENIAITADENLDIACKNFTSSVVEDSKIEVGGNHSEMVGGDVTIEVGGSYSSTSGGDTSIKAPKIKLDGVVETTSTISAAGDINSGGGMNATGTIKSDSKVEALKIEGTVEVKGPTGKW